jgi:glycosyltransferase involved in cell wall biosynthesis
LSTIAREHPVSQPRSTLCLNMIVKNERAVIERCLASVKSLISHWVIVDTGSSDGTQEVIRSFLREIPGQLVERPWVNFAHNRSEALDFAVGKADYLLFIDADEVLEFDADFVWPELAADAYSIETRLHGISYRRIQLVRNSGDWRYKGVLHEYITSPNRKITDRLAGVVNLPYQDGARSADAQKSRRDALTLEQALLEEPDNSRYVLYLGNSYRDARDYEAALKQYRRRADMGGDPEEVWYALYQAALMRVLLDEPWEKTLHGLLQAYASWPMRAEPLYHLSVHYRLRREYPAAELFAQQAAAIPCPEDALLVELDVYAYRIAFECAICCYWSGRHAEAVRLNNHVVSAPGVASEIFAQAIKNRRLSLEAIYRVNALAQPRVNRFRIFVPFRNPGTFFDNCIASLMGQTYQAFFVAFYDAGSDDGSHRYIPDDDPRAVQVRGQESMSIAEARHHFIMEQCQPDDIFVHVDGADWLAHDDVLATLNRLYNRYDCDLLYGQYQQADGTCGRSLPYPDEQALRDFEGAGFPHFIQTFRAGLYQGIAEQDPQYACQKDAHGRWYDAPQRDDRALMAPLLRRAGFAKVRFNDEVLYVLNTDRDADRTCVVSR